MRVSFAVNSFLVAELEDEGFFEEPDSCSLDCTDDMILVFISLIMDSVFDLYVLRKSLPIFSRSGTISASSLTFENWFSASCLSSSDPSLLTNCYVTPNRSSKFR